MFSNMTSVQLPTMLLLGRQQLLSPAAVARCTQGLLQQLAAGIATTSTAQASSSSSSNCHGTAHLGPNSSSSSSTSMSDVAASYEHTSSGSGPCSSTMTSSKAAGLRHCHSSATAALSTPGVHGTTVLCVRKDGQVVMMADGQITQGAKVVKPNAKKLRRLAADPVPSLGGFAGSTADGLTLFERLEQRLEEHPGQLRRAAVELAKVWRQDRVLRHLEATMIIADATTCLEVSGRGDLLEPADGIHAIGSGARFAIAAARALITVPGLAPLNIAQRAMKIAAEKCVYTNSNIIWEVIGADGQLESGSTGKL
eukprot:GHRR01011479.1.p1 GENE.GHRR01011479.1~~GHRR01011479.1.p1  ORF type:complete len:311 (+),score=96.07 GHRR01011479.1:432-1364(+)